MFADLCCCCCVCLSCFEKQVRLQADQERKVEELVAVLRSVDGTPRGGSRPNSFRRTGERQRLDSGEGLASPDWGDAVAMVFAPVRETNYGEVRLVMDLRQPSRWTGR